MGRARLERTAFILSAPAPGHGGRGARPPCAGAELERLSGSAEPCDGKLLRTGTGIHGGAG